MDPGNSTSLGNFNIAGDLSQGHKIKNPRTQLAQRLRELAVRLPVIISGTPIQNDLMELHALLSFVCPVRGARGPPPLPPCATRAQTAGGASRYVYVTGVPAARDLLSGYMRHSSAGKAAF